MGRLKKWRLRRAYRLVFKDLCKVSMFRGVYDAKNGSDDFMYGVSMVMEAIAFEAENFDFEAMFMDNMTRSMVKAGILHDENK